MKISRSGILQIASAVLLVAALFGCQKKEAPAVQNDNPKTEAPTTPTNPPPSTTVTNGSITPEEARNHIGEDAVVRGEVTRVNVSQKGDVFMDMGGSNSDATFTVVCFKQAVPTEDLRNLMGKTVSFKGRIKEYKGKAEMILNSKDQIIE